MLTFKKSKRYINIVLDDYVLRIIENSGQDISSIRLVKEFMLPAGMIEHGKIKDELAFYDFMKNIVKELKIKNRPVRFYVPNALVIMRQVDIPAHLEGDAIKEHMMLEIGASLHLPFDNPVFDVHILPREDEALATNTNNSQETKQGILFAVPEAELLKYTEIFVDVSLKPMVADVEALGIYRYFYYMSDSFNEDAVYLIFKLNLTSTNISIFHRHQVEFLRFQHLDIDPTAWTMEETEDKKQHWVYQGDEAKLIGSIEDQIRELSRLMNFYRYSMNQGEKQVSHIVLTGDYPQIKEVMENMQTVYDLPITLLSGYLSKEKTDKLGTAYVPTLGLALKGAGAS